MYTFLQENASGGLVVQRKWDLSSVACLIAEDNPHMRTILRSVLAGFGIRSVFEATDGTEALELVVDRRPDLVLCDWAMEPFGGADFLRFLRKDRDPLVNTTPVLIVTAYARRAIIMEAIDLGIHGFVAKPIAPAILYAHIGEILERQEMQGRSKGIPGPGQNRTAPRSTHADTRAPVGTVAPLKPGGGQQDGLALL
ncbi:response regulator [Rhodobacterales bacterium]|nr:response regulator [Rhodobacterales bacterium]